MAAEIIFCTKNCVVIVLNIIYMKHVYLGKLNKGLICHMSIPIYCNFLSNVYPNYSTNTHF